MTLTVQIQDSLREFVQSITVKKGDADSLTEAGMHFAEGLAILAQTQFDTKVVYEPEPIQLVRLTHHTTAFWRVQFNWEAALTSNLWSADNDDELTGADGSEP